MEETKPNYGTITMTQGTEICIDGVDHINEIQDKIREFFNLKNVNFLIGSGASNGAIPIMKELFSRLEFSKEEGEIKNEFDQIVAQCGENLENCLNVMYAAKTHYQGLKATDTTQQETIDSCLSRYNKLIQKIETHIFDNINIEIESEENKKILELYKSFYQKLALRTKDTSRIRVFTTNNDLFNETALDALNIHYINGFSGGLHKYFNPAIFNYTFSKRMDTSIDKYEPIENMVYLYKIHGSINWKDTDNLLNNYFGIEEVNPSKVEPDGSVLIYPTPTKQDKSLGSPYVDLFREFQNKLLEPHSVLFVIGYSFSDRHVNDIIYRALATNSTINIVIFASRPDTNSSKEKPIFFINDNRIFTIGGEIYEDEEKKNFKYKVHHFKYIVENLLPDLNSLGKEDDILNKFIENLKKVKSQSDENREDNISRV